MLSYIRITKKVGVNNNDFDCSSFKKKKHSCLFQLLCGSGAPYDEKITLRVLKGSDLTARDCKGNTILHIAILYHASETVLKFLLNNGVDIAARDCQGRTARDVAEKHNCPNYVKLIDEFIIKIVKDKKFDQIERLILHNYDHLLDIKDGSRTLVDTAKRSSTSNIHEIIRLTAPIQVRLILAKIVFPTLYFHISNDTDASVHYFFLETQE